MSHDECTAASYEPGNPRHNVKVFLSLWGHEVLWVNDDGTVFEAGDSSGGHASFADLVECLAATDTHDHLSEEDANAAIAMLYHVTPPRKSVTRDEVLGLAKAVRDKMGREAVKEVIGRYAESFGKVRDDQLELLWHDLMDLQSGGRA